MISRRLGASVACVALVVAACSGDDTSTTITSATSLPTATTAPPATTDETTTTDAGATTTDPPPDTAPTTAPDDGFPDPVPEFDARPIIFVHGGSGSGAQFQAQAMRFASNGYPIDRLRVVDYDSTNVGGADVPSVLDALIAALQAASGHDQVDLIGHSLGTAVSSDYLTSDPARAANVAHYVNVDGRILDAPPGGVATLALWGEAGFGRRTGPAQIPGATNVTFDDQAHVEVATSPESFAEMFRFFNDGREPLTLDIVPQRSEDLTIAGRAVHFPQNEGVPEGTLEIYEVDPDTGFRLRDEPDATFTLSGDGSFGPFDGEHGATYEMLIVRGAEDRLHHFYLQPLVRSDHLVRLNTSPRGGGVGALLETSDDSVGFVISRYREWWGDQGDGSDILEIDGVNLLNEATSPRSNNSIGVLVFDVGGDSEANLDEPISTLFAIGFLTGVDLFVPSADPPDRSLAVRVVPRGDASRESVVQVPNWSSTEHAISVHFVE